jgi:hypothetical protein
VNDTAAPTTAESAASIQEESRFADDPIAMQRRLASWLVDVALSARTPDEVDDAA